MAEITDARSGPERRAQIDPFYRQTLRLERGSHPPKAHGCAVPWRLCLSGCPHVTRRVSGNALVSVTPPLRLCLRVSDSAVRVFLPVSVLYLCPAPLPRTTTTLLPLFQDKGAECGGVLGPTQPPHQGREQGGTLSPGPFPAPKAQESEESRVGRKGCGVRSSGG